MLSVRKYMTLSVAAASAVIYHAFATRRQFFPTAVYLSTSKLAVAAVGNLSFAMALAMYNLVIKVFLGTLREIELERVKEKLSSAIMETCLALTIFREEFNIGFVGMFTVLTFVKVFHWLVEDRVDYIEVTPSVSRLAHVRIVSFLLVLLGMDVLFLHHTIAATLDQKGHSVQLLFAFEYIILASTAAATLLKYLLSMLDTAMEGRWEGKGTYVFYLELLKDMMHLFVYCIFFVIVFSNYGLPLHLIRDLYMTFRNFKARIADFLRFRQVTARMDRFPDATAQDLARCDGICIICREEMAPAGLNKKLHCGHVFHLHCLRSWLERQQNCPTCRMSVFRPPPAHTAPAAGAPPAAAGGAAAAAEPDAAAVPDAPAVPGAAAAAAGAGPAGAAGLVAPPAAAAAGAPRPPSRSGRSSGGGHRAPGAAAGAAGVPAAAGGVGAGGAGAAAAAPGGFGGFPALHPGQAGAAPSSSRRDRGGSGSRERGREAFREGFRRGAAAAAANGAAAAGGEVPAAGIPAGYWPGSGAAAMPAAGLMWQMPQWYPVTSMAAFSNTPLQYAGQQSAVDQAQAAQALAAASMVPMVPAIIPAISAPFSAVLSPPVSMAPNATPEQAQAAAAAAMAAAAAAAMYMPPMMPGLALMPPAMLPGGAAPGSGQEQMAAAAAANAAAAAAAAVMGGAATPEVMQASFEATQQMLQRQLDYLQSQMSRIRTNGGGSGDAAAAPAAAATPPAPAAEAGTSAAAAAGPSSSAGAVPAAAVQQQQQPEQPAAETKDAGDTPAAIGPAEASSSGAAAAGAPDQAESGGVPEAAAGEEEKETAEQLRRRRLLRFEGAEQGGDQA